MKVPGAADLDAAWDTLPPEAVRQIGRLALDMVFYGFLGGDAYGEADKVLTDRDARGAAEDVSSRCLCDLYTVIEDALPNLFGPANENPAWANREKETLSS